MSVLSIQMSSIKENGGFGRGTLLEKILIVFGIYIFNGNSYD